MENQNNIILQAAKQDLEAVCKKHDIILLPVIVHQGDRTLSSIEIVPRSEVQAPNVEAMPEPKLPTPEMP